MGRTKSRKIELKNATIKEDSGRLVIIEHDEIDLNTEVDKLNVVDELKKFENVNIKFIVKENKQRNSKPRQPVYKYKCPQCERLIKSKEENLEVRCNKCQKDFEIVEE